MTNVGITGHMNLSPESAGSVYAAIRDDLESLQADELVGLSCLAVGADSIFAQAVLDVGGALEVVLPAKDYRQAKVKPTHAAQFDALLDRAATVHFMPFTNSSQEAYEAANEYLVGRAERLLAVWDGRPSNGRGGTADVVNYARARGVPVTVIWPAGARRS